MYNNNIGVNPVGNNGVIAHLLILKLFDVVSGVPQGTVLYYTVVF